MAEFCEVLFCFHPNQIKGEAVGGRIAKKYALIVHSNWKGGFWWFIKET